MQNKHQFDFLSLVLTQRDGNIPFVQLKDSDKEDLVIQFIFSK